MAQHNPQSIPYLVIVMAGIVVGFTIALSILHGGGSHKTTDHDTAHKSEASDTTHGHANNKPSDEKMGHDGPSADKALDGAALDGAAHDN